MKINEVEDKIITNELNCKDIPGNNSMKKKHRIIPNSIPVNCCSKGSGSLVGFKDILNQ